MIRVLIVAEIKLYREGLAEILGRSECFEATATASTGEQAFARVGGLSPDVVLLDMSMPRSFAIARDLADRYPKVRTVGLAIPDVEKDVIACVEAGVVGWVPQEASLDDLMTIVRSAVDGEVQCSPLVAGRIVRRLRRLAAKKAPTQSFNLTPRQMEILDLIDRGLSNKQIASRLCIEISTVKNHIHTIFEKLHVRRRGAAAAKLRAAQWIADPPRHEI